MEQPGPNQPLHEIPTRWSEVLRAQQNEVEAHSARERMVLRYIGAVRHYIACVLRDEIAAEELAQEFAVRVLRGDFRGADPNRGRFRDYLKAAARNLVRDYLRRSNVRPSPRSAELAEPAAPPVEAEEPDAEFLRSWRRELFHRAMGSLAEYQERTGRPYHDIINLRAEQPDLTSAQLAAQLAERTGDPTSAGGVRQTLRRARACLVDILLDEVAFSLENPSLDALEQELIILDLLEYCREGLRHRGQRVRGSD